MEAQIHNVVVKKVVYERPKIDKDGNEGDPKVTVTLEIDADHMAMTKQMLDFAAAGACTWSVSFLRREGALP